jgi:hypothetical protein
MNLPKLTLSLRERDPEFVARFEPGNNTAVNMDEYYKMYEIEVEVVQLNLNSQGMRVRYPWPNKNKKSGFEVVSRDVPVGSFFDKYKIEAK